MAPASNQSDSEPAVRRQRRESAGGACPETKGRADESAPMMARPVSNQDMSVRWGLAQFLLVACATISDCQQSQGAKPETSSSPPTVPVPPQPPTAVECIPATKLPKAPRKVHDQRPAWSEINVRTHGGTLAYEITIGPSGDVVDVRQITRAGSKGPSPRIAEAYSRAILKWRFEPTLVGTELVSVCMTVTVTIDT